jgi:hypothetical protein
VIELNCARGSLFPKSLCVCPQMILEFNDSAINLVLYSHCVKKGKLSKFSDAVVVEMSNLSMYFFATFLRMAFRSIRALS